MGPPPAGSSTRKMAPPPGALRAWTLAVVGLDDCFDDRETETGATRPPPASLVCAPEAFEHLVAGFHGQAGSVVADLEHGAILLATRTHLDRRALRRVDQRIAGEVGQHLT